MDNSKFIDLYNRLNTEQKKAVDTIEGPVLVSAGPGTGKTQILILRIANILLKTQINPQNILALTFTESAAFEIKKRLVEIIGPAGYRVNIYTFHGFCNMLIQEYPHEFPSLIGASPITELDQIELMEKILAETPLDILKPIGDPFYYTRTALAAIADLKKEGITPETFTDGIQKEEQAFAAIPDLYYTDGRYEGKMKGAYKDLQKSLEKNKELLLVFTKYQDALKENHAYDFSDMLLATLESFATHPDFLLTLQEKYHYFLVDEHQDTNTAQNKIVEFLASFFESPNLFVVGDDKQAIYRFQGASLDNFLFFKHRYPQSLFLELKQNYRSTSHILKASESVITRNAQRLSNSTLEPNSAAISEPVGILSFQTAPAEDGYIAQSINSFIADGVIPEEIAILVRNNRDITSIALALEREGIPYFASSNQNILRDTYVQQFLLILRTINDPTDDKLLARFFHLQCFKIPLLHLYTLLTTARKEHISLLQLIEKQKQESLLPTEMVQTYNLLSSWMQMKHERLREVFVFALQQSCLLEEIIKLPEAQSIIDKINRLYEKLKELEMRKEFLTLEDFIAHIDLLEKHHLGIENTLPEISQKGVRIMTAHRAKGKEFDIVFIAHATESGFGNVRSRGSGFDLPWEYMVPLLSEETSSSAEDERRLFYVALTRARKKIFISFSETDENNNHLLPTPFLGEIDPEFTETIDVSAFEKTFSENLELTHIKEPVPLLSDRRSELQKFFWDQLKEVGLSATSINMFLSCPWHYVFKGLLGLPDVKTESLVYGSAIHAAVSNYIKANKKLSEAQLLSAFTTALSQEGLTPVMHDRLVLQAQRELPGFIANIITPLSDTILSEVSIKNVHFNTDISLSGRIDMLEQKDKEWVIHDLKATRPKSRNSLEKDDESGDYKRQLIFYSLLTQNFDQGRFATQDTVLDFVKPTDAGIYKSEQFIIIEEDLQQMRGLIQQCIDATHSLSFWVKTCDNPDCEYCQLSKQITNV